MKSRPGRLWPVVAGFSLVLLIGCQESPPHKSAPGNLPGRVRAEKEPQINAMTYFAHGHLLERQGNFERAVVQYRKTLALQPDFLSARNRLGITLNKLGRHEEATEQFRMALVGHPALAYLYNNLGFSLYLEADYVEAETALTQALELKSNYPRARMNYGLVLARLERFDEAYTQLQQVGNAADAYFNMGVILTEAEKYAEAAHYLEAALTARPDFAAARHQLREVSRLAAENEARQAAIQLALSSEPAPPETTSALPESSPDNQSVEAPADLGVDDGRTEAVVQTEEPEQSPVEPPTEQVAEVGEDEAMVAVSDQPAAEAGERIGDRVEERNGGGRRRSGGARGG